MIAQTSDDNGNIVTQAFAHRYGDPCNLHAYDNLDRLTETDYLVGVLTEDEQFTYDLLGNRMTLNDRANNNVVYAHNLANEYTAVGAQSVYYDEAGNLTTDYRGYTYYYDYKIT